MAEAASTVTADFTVAEASTVAVVFTVEEVFTVADAAKKLRS
jgi:hypothetical protein